jgi:hypothetical protein
MTKDEALEILMKQYARLHYHDDCKRYAEGFNAGWTGAEQNVVLSYLAERHFCQRCGKRLMSALGPVSLHTCCPPQGRTFDDYGNKLP